jgi:hypothetical protein
MKITAIIPHYAVGKITAYTISQLLKHKGNHDLRIVVVDNKASDGSAKYLNPFMKDIIYAVYPADQLQSHGIAVHWALKCGLVNTDYILTLENDSFPIKDGYLDYYENLINDGYDMAGSLLQLSGGEYVHGAGAIYKVSLWEEARKFIDETPYFYFPNMSRRNGFDCHTMIHNKIVDKVLDAPNDWVELSEGYKGLSKEGMYERAKYYAATKNPFHNGMGGLQEDVKTYGFRNVENDSPAILLENAQKIVFRIGYEPNQWLSYFAHQTGKKIFHIPTEIKWMEGREGQQQEYTINESGIKHLWAISSYTERPADGVEDIFKEKRELPEKLYNTLPIHQKIN